MATSRKKQRLDDRQTALKDSVETCAKIPCRCLSFVMCNAATSHPYSFSEAVCETIPYGHKYAFGSFFENGVILLNNYLSDPAAFKAASEQEQLVVHRLLDFIGDEDNKQHLMNVIYYGDVSEARAAPTIANHLVSKLVLNPSFILDRNYGKIDHCPCGCKSEIRKYYGDTSYGNKMVWHGTADILANELSVAIRNVTSTDDSPGMSSFEVKLDCDKVKNIENQLIAQTVCFSFLQIQRHPEYINTLVPFIGISCKEVMIYMYDSAKDRFVQAVVLNLFEEKYKKDSASTEDEITSTEDGTSSDDESTPAQGIVEANVCMSTIIALWLTLNYKLFSSLSRPISDFVQTLPPADFFKVAKDKLKFYKKDLKFGDIGSPPSPKLFRRTGTPSETIHLKGSEKMKSLGYTQ